MKCCERQPFRDHFEYVKRLRSGVQLCSGYSPIGVTTAFAPTSLVKDQDDVVLNNTEGSIRSQKTWSKLWDDPALRAFLPCLKALSYILQNDRILWIIFSKTFQINVSTGPVILSTLNVSLQRPLNAATFREKLKESDLNMLSLKTRIFLNLKKEMKKWFSIQYSY